VSGQVFLLGDEVFVRGTAIARLGYLSTEADELVLKTQHLGEQELIAGISLRDAADLKTDFEDMGFPVRLKEGAVPRTAARRDAIPKNVRHEVWRRDGGQCVDCRSRERLEFDHIIPVSKGGSNTARNIELRCQDCNREKAARI